MQQKIFIGLVLTLIIVIFIPVYWATEAGRQEAARQRIKAEAVGRGAELYASHCASCHGPAGEGRVGPALKGSPLDENVLSKIIARGIPGTAMPASAAEEGGSLKKHQIEDLTTFIKNWDQSLVEAPPSPAPAPKPSSTPAPTPAPSPTPAPAAAPKPSPTPAPAAQASGKNLYALKCAICHGANGEGTGVGPPVAGYSISATKTQVRNPTGTMMAFPPSQLSDPELNEIADFIASLSKAKAQ